MDLLRKDPADRPPSAVEAAVTARPPDGAPLPNATVRVDGESVGYTPQRLTRRAGQHTIRVEKEGYMPPGGRSSSSRTWRRLSSSSCPVRSSAKAQVTAPRRGDASGSRLWLAAEACRSRWRPFRNGASSCRCGCPVPLDDRPQASPRAAPEGRATPASPLLCARRRGRADPRRSRTDRRQPHRSRRASRHQPGHTLPPPRRVRHRVTYAADKRPPVAKYPATGICRFKNSLLTPLPADALNPRCIAIVKGDAVELR